MWFLLVGVLFGTLPKRNCHNCRSCSRTNFLELQWCRARYQDWCLSPLQVFQTFLGTRGSTMRTYKAVQKTIADFPISQCSPLACRRLASASYGVWTEISQAKCSNPSTPHCYAHTTTEPLPIIGSQGLNKCENLANVALSGGKLVTPTATGLKLLSHSAMNI